MPAKSPALRRVRPFVLLILGFPGAGEAQIRSDLPALLTVRSLSAPDELGAQRELFREVLRHGGFHSVAQNRASGADDRFTTRLGVARAAAWSRLGRALVDSQVGWQRDCHLPAASFQIGVTS